MLHLPIMDYKSEIVSAVTANRVTIIQAETGAGKSTQVPQMLYEAGFSRITVTQPRIMAAVSLAMRVAEEMGEEVGKTVGYKTRFEKTHSHTPITYVTDGYMLSSCGNDATQGIVIMDEVHEFNLNIETLLGLYKRELKTNSNFKVVIMSATIDSEKISDFFDGAPIIKIPGKLFPIKRLWEPTMSVVDCIVKYFKPASNMLVFLPGKEEISKARTDLNWYFRANAKNKPQIFDLHGEMSYNDQKAVFDSFEEGKIILSTNVSQTSITVPDVDFVIDTGLAKETNLTDGVSTLATVKISRADCDQRAGRAGRCKDGTYVLCSSCRIEERQEFSVPEIQRISLESLLLKLVKLNINPLEIEFIHNPNRNNLSTAKATLQSIGAITSDGRLTEIGEKMAEMPVSPRIARMLIEGRKYSDEVQGDLAIIAALIECGDFRGADFYDRYLNKTSEEAKKSDLTYLLTLFKALNAEYHKLESQARKDFYKSNGLKAKIYQNILKISKDIADRFGLKYMRDQKTSEDSFLFIRKCIIAAYSDCVYTLQWNWDKTYCNKEGTRRLNRQSVFSEGVYLPDVVVAMPLDIEVKKGYNHYTVALICNATSVDVSEEPAIYEELLKNAEMEYEYDEEEQILYEVCKVGGLILKKEISNANYYTETVSYYEFFWKMQVTKLYVEGVYIRTLHCERISC